MKQSEMLCSVVVAKCLHVSFYAFRKKKLNSAEHTDTVHWFLSQ